MRQKVATVPLRRNTICQRLLPLGTKGVEPEVPSETFKDGDLMFRTSWVQQQVSR